ncbi:hypothetical protein BZA77DRAFT_308768 [Pyronema omphalodes]|nr:hypothetical protein BZA77DRAFT_308768 [Pyronema omphalodes]
MAPSRPVPTSTTIKVHNSGTPAIYAIHSGPQRGVHLLSSTPLDSSLQYRYRHPINVHRTFLTVSGDFLRRRFDTIEAAIKWIDERDREKELSDRLEAVCMTGVARSSSADTPATPIPATNIQPQQLPTNGTNPVRTWINLTPGAVSNDTRIDTPATDADHDMSSMSTTPVAAPSAQQTSGQTQEQYTEYTLPSGLVVRRLKGPATTTQDQSQNPAPKKEKWLIDRYCPGGEEAEVQMAAEQAKIQNIIDELEELTTEDDEAARERKIKRDREREIREQRKKEPVWKHVQMGGIKKVSQATHAPQSSAAAQTSQALSAESLPSPRRGITMDVVAVKGRYSMTHLGVRRRELLYSLVVEEQDKEAIRRQEEQERINRLQLAGIRTGDIVGRLRTMDLELTKAESIVADDGMEIEEDSCPGKSG